VVIKSRFQLNAGNSNRILAQLRITFNYKIYLRSSKVSVNDQVPRMRVLANLTKKYIFQSVVCSVLEVRHTIYGTNYVVGLIK